MLPLKIGRLPDRTLVRMSFRAGPELARSLRAYAELYSETYGQAAAVPDLIPHMLESFLASDRAFALVRKAERAGRGAGPATTGPSAQKGQNRADLFAPSAAKEG
ncbi:DUF2274 domain-containing protein [Mycobacterium sp. KBS0706]|uniref:DUF2274 domain-containing protein n=1 Tax=Mycobacterium sp. KBS0706 TaxID=2578109 RepID=UPI00110FF52F|nr:DUF2274 domain-containing protein [Mycobacterium sp. KBS0706]TSD84634.1 DUF2274 domain-containing protein [Mycobacterium sp. KBS0706]